MGAHDTEISADSRRVVGLVQQLEVAVIVARFLVPQRWVLGGVALGVMLLPVVGAAQSASDKQVTFTKDIAPILQRSCVTCHRQGEMAPMALMTYEDARPWARAIKTRVTSREMPPWNIGHDRDHEVQERSSLSDAEIAMIAKWAMRRAARIRPTCRRFASSPTPTSGRSASPI
jgi:hypothetical protein